MQKVTDSSYSTHRRVIHGKLAYFQEAASPEYWDSLWSGQDIESNLKSARSGGLGYIQESCLKYLPKRGIVLEAGCGPGFILTALIARGYHAEGIEWAAATVDLAKKFNPKVPIRRGDVKKIDVPDGYYSGYISLGVVEHDICGPDAFLSEAYRVLCQGGIALISVPHFHILRRLNARIGAYRRPMNNDEFYQYAFGCRDFATCLRNVGFRVLEMHGYDAIKGLSDETRVFRLILKLPRIGRRLRRFMEKSLLIKKLTGHMMLYVVQKPM